MEDLKGGWRRKGLDEDEVEQGDKKTESIFVNEVFIPSEFILS
jgi:hypothetical protein